MRTRHLIALLQISEFEEADDMTCLTEDTESYLVLEDLIVARADGLPSLTERARVYVDAVLGINLPVQFWAIPEGEDDAVEEQQAGQVHGDGGAQPGQGEKKKKAKQGGRKRVRRG